jgi:biotin carboxyl carrier protein
METVVAAPRAGVVKSVAVAVSDNLEAGDLVAIIE